MNVNSEKANRPVVGERLRLIGLLLCAGLLSRLPDVPKVDAQEIPGPTYARAFAYSDEANQHILKPGHVIPPGTILPVRLNSSLSFSKIKAGQAISARVMQDVSLPGGSKIPAGSNAEGHVVATTPATKGSLATISLQFDKLRARHQTIPISTNLRAMAGFMAVQETQIPPIGPGEGDVYDWLTTIQIGGDVVYGQGGKVTNDSSQVVGKSVPGGVLSQVSAKEGTKCRGPLFGNSSPQALWVFSSDACGIYGLEHLNIVHAGRAAPVGTIILASTRKDLTIQSGAGMLLRVDAGGN